MSRLIYVVDNGETYSDNSIAFVSTTWPRDVVELAVRARNPGATLEGAFSEVAWWEGEFVSLEELVYVFKLIDDKECIRELPLDFLRGVLALEASNSIHRPRLAELIAQREASARPSPLEGGEP